MSRAEILKWIRELERLLDYRLRTAEEIAILKERIAFLEECEVTE